MRALLVLLALALAACGDSPQPESPAATLTVRALYVESMYDGQAMMVNHEAIPDRMPAMRMPFRVTEPALLDGVPQGAPVRLTLDSTSLVVVAIETLPAGTDLDLHEGGDDGQGVVILPPE